VHVYAAAGTYDVTLTVTDDGAVDSAGQAATVDAGDPVDTPPVASFSYSCSSLSCTFDGTLSTDDHGIASYAWDFGDGLGSILAVPAHTYAAQGIYTVTLSVVDTGGTNDSVSASFRVKNRGSASGSTGDGGDTGAMEKGAKKCSDGIDNDGDGFVDSADPDCQ
jgi:PKD repeat protein